MMVKICYLYNLLYMLKPPKIREVTPHSKYPSFRKIDQHPYYCKTILMSLVCCKVDCFSYSVRTYIHFYAFSNLISNILVSNNDIICMWNILMFPSILSNNYNTFLLYP